MQLSVNLMSCEMALKRPQTSSCGCCFYLPSSSSTDVDIRHDSARRTLAPPPTCRQRNPLFFGAARSESVSLLGRKREGLDRKSHGRLIIPEGLPFGGKPRCSSSTSAGGAGGGRGLLAVGVVPPSQETTTLAKRRDDRCAKVLEASSNFLRRSATVLDNSPQSTTYETRALASLSS